METIITYIIAPLLTSVLAWFLARRKYAAEAKSSEVANFEAYVNANRLMIDDLKHRIEQLTVSNRELREKIEQLEKEFPCTGCPRRHQ
jgi:predicted RNase H-like nuclease (RuvC/YqgF family)